MVGKFHACDNDGANCIDFVDAVFGGKGGHVCWCECHPWNNHEHTEAENAELRKRMGEK